jgi:hypothetical protein
VKDRAASGGPALLLSRATTDGPHRSARPEHMKALGSIDRSKDNIGHDDSQETQGFWQTAPAMVGAAGGGREKGLLMRGSI